MVDVLANSRAGRGSDILSAGGYSNNYDGSLRPVLSMPPVAILHDGETVIHPNAVGPLAGRQRVRFADFDFHGNRQQPVGWQMPCFAGLRW